MNKGIEVPKGSVILMTDKELRQVINILDDILQHHESDAWKKLEQLQKNYKKTETFKSPYVGK